jgi:hypothetical protein
MMATNTDGSEGWMIGLDPTVGTAENYRRFARREAAGRSPAYETLALAVAGDVGVLEFLTGLPVAKRQPNLFFAAARFLLAATPDPDALRALIDRRPGDLRRVMLTRRTQTNEIARCATLLPALCRLRQPLALIEVGASAGLTLLVDRYSYDFDGHRVDGLDPAAPTLLCHLEGPVPVPETVPEVVWRRGLDLNPLDPGDDADLHWLECLIWPGEEGRMERLRAAASTARRHPVSVERGDLMDRLTELVAAAPSGVTTVVFHSAVLAYVDTGRRTPFARMVRDLGVHWLSNEAPGVLEGPTSTAERGGFLLVENGANVLAETDPHGTWLRWVNSDAP